MNGIVHHRRHACANRGAVNERGIGSLTDQRPDLIGHFQQFKNTSSSSIASAAAAFAATPAAPPAWNTLPCWYLLGTEDKAIPPALQRFMAERANATIVEVPASHVSFVSQPEAATELILQAVTATAA